ncbi:RNA-directed DNA polymerase [Clostridium diolis]|uniref:RNA-directed DNA polymerase n=1 Tax=Clostridium diolis TaxID=223919 RepID=UPI003AF596A0
MSFDNIKRNSLDYILTDILPIEISELYTNKFFYDFMIKNNNWLECILKKIIIDKNNTNEHRKLFEDAKWTSLPLKYTVAKNSNAVRTLNILHPVAAIELFLFVASYEKEIVNLLEKGSVYSLRYHKKNNDLYYKSKNKRTIKYFEDVSQEIDKEVIEQTGLYFKIQPFSSIAAFTKSDRWFTLNSQFKYFARTDYKSCFDSVYTHTYKWLIGKDVNDTKEFNNGNLFTTIDRVLQNINARTSNGIVVGPEFSRMIAEILLQGIDSAVFNRLLNNGIKPNEQYNVYRYVDDIFIFASTEEILNTILKNYEEIAGKYLLSLNESKLVREKLPFILNVWLKETSNYVTQASSIIFYTKQERDKYSVDKQEEHKRELGDEQPDKLIDISLLRSRVFLNSRLTLMQKFNELICMYPQKTKTIVAYTYGMILNKIQSTRNYVKLFKTNASENVIYYFLDYIFYIYSYYPDFNNTQRLISLISYVNDEIDLIENRNHLIQKLINKYAFIFDKANINDIINLILLCTILKIEIPYVQERNLLDRIRVEDNPIVWATYLLYSKYDKEYYEIIINEIENLIEDRMDSILNKKSILTYREFWWLLVFNKCPFITKTSQNIFDKIINDNWNSEITDNSSPAEISTFLFGEYLRKGAKQFFEWDIENKTLLKEITYKTLRRTIFKNYNGNLRFMEFTSID